MDLESRDTVMYFIACQKERRELDMKVAIANDHAGVKLKDALKGWMEEHGYEVINLGTDGEKSTDYPDYVREAAVLVQEGKAAFGIVICGTGIGASITANKFKGVHAALCYSVFTAKMARNHNNANVISLGARTIHEDDAIAMVKTFLSEQFYGDRHARRVDKILSIEQQNFNA
jgi:ribose 5-phosphate isomerase B